MKDEQFASRVNEVLQKELETPEKWLYVSFATETEFCGAVVIQAHGLTDALMKINALGINPHGEVLAFPIPDDGSFQMPEEKFRNVLLSKKQVKELWPDAMSIREFEEEQRG
jgi:hypothetical protein